MSTLNFKQIEDIRVEIQKCIAYAQYWSVFATSQTNYNRIVTDGSGRQHNRLDLEKEAFDTALNYIRRIQDLQETLRNIQL